MPLLKGPGKDVCQVMRAFQLTGREPLHPRNTFDGLEVQIISAEIIKGLENGSVPRSTGTS